MAEILIESTTTSLDTMVAPVDDLVEEMEAHAVDEDIPIVARLQAILSRATGGCDVDKCTVTSLAAPQHSLRDD